MGFTVANLLFGIGGVVICYIFSGEVDIVSPSEQDVPELHLLALIYTITVKSDDKDDAKIWAIVAFAAILLAGFISMVSL